MGGRSAKTGKEYTRQLPTAKRCSNSKTERGMIVEIDEVQLWTDINSKIESLWEQDLESCSDAIKIDELAEILKKYGI